MQPIKTNPASFRDPSGYIFEYQGGIYRKINPIYLPIYQMIMKSGFYTKLTDNNLMIHHTEIDRNKFEDDTSDQGIIIKPDQLPFISYPYEWSFSMLKDAALLTLDICLTALDYGMILKDASAYNVQFNKNMPIFIDTLSFEKFTDKPWIAYRQFCQHFLAPLAITAYTKIPANKLLTIYLDGIPLSIASKMLPYKSYFNFGLFTHIHLHAGAQKKYENSKMGISQNNKNISENSIRGLLTILKSTITNLHLIYHKSEWSAYYENRESYTEIAYKHKQQIVTQIIKDLKPQTLLDLGANTGEFSLIATDQNIITVSSDYDHLAVELNYTRQNKSPFLLPLVIDLTNPSPAIGWQNQERRAFFERFVNFDLTLSLALLHHLYFSFHIKFEMFFKQLFQITQKAIVEFIPMEDPMVEKLIHNRKETIIPYTEDDFRLQYEKYFQVITIQNINDSLRKLYVLDKKTNQ